MLVCDYQTFKDRKGQGHLQARASGCQYIPNIRLLWKIKMFTLYIKWLLTYKLQHILKTNILK